MASRIPQTFIDEVLIRTDIVTLIDNRIPLRKQGSNYLACCPFHDEKTPSFTVNPVKQLYYCFGCNVSGNAISFLIEYERLDFIPAIELLAEQAGLSIPQEAQHPTQKNQADLYAVMAKAADYYQNQLKRHPEAIAYLKQRGLSGQIAKTFALGYAPNGWNNLNHALGNSAPLNKSLIDCGLIISKEQKTYDRFRQRIMFPIKDRQGRIIGFGGRVLDDSLPKYLNSPETAIFHKGRELYGLYEARQQHRELDRILIVEGYMDVIALAQQGITYAVATLGTATTADHLQQLFRYAPEIIFCFDGDRAGQAAGWKALEQTLPFMQDGRQVRFMFLAQNEDPDSFIRKVGLNGFQTAMRQAIPLTDFLLNNLLAKVDISGIAGKANLAAKAKPLLEKMPAGIFQQLLLEQLAQRMRLDVQQLSALLFEKTKSKEGSLLKEHIRPLLQIQSPMQMALSLLLQNPELAKTVDASILSELILPGGDILIQLVTTLKQQPELTTGGLLEYWREHSAFPHLTRLANWEHLIPASKTKQEFTATLKHLQKINHEAKIDKLLTKGHQQGLDAEEKQILNRLLNQTKD